MELPRLDDAHPHLAEVVPSVLGALGVPGAPRSVELPDVRSACVLLIDGLGWQLLERHAEDAPVLAGLSRSPLRVGYPSTTVAGLAAVGTGLAAGEHGLVGYSFEVPGAGVLNALTWHPHPRGTELSREVAAEEVQPEPTTFSRAAEAGLRSCVVSDAQFKHSALTRAALRGGDYLGVHALGDLAVHTCRVLGTPGSFCYAYHSELDKIGHVYGPGTDEWRAQLRHVDQLVDTVAASLQVDALLAVVADHGMVDVDSSAVDVDVDQRLRNGVRAIGGEARARHVYVRDGAEAEVLAAWRETLGEHAWVASREEAIEAGWFGPRVADRVRPRIGDVVAAARGNSAMLRRQAEPFESALRGHHGSLTDAEQLVPLALAHG